jgi:signal transduction histidine kinase
MRPLDRLPSIKLKLGVVIVAAVAVTVTLMLIGAQLRWPLLPQGLVAGAVALLMVHFLARGMTSPLREMADAATDMARGDLGRTVTATSRDEVGDLARAFNKMAAELAEVDRIRRDLVANVSHELRTPISALQAVLENLIDGVEQPDGETLSTMLVQVERLGRLVAQLLDLSRLESGAAPLQPRVFNVKSVLEQAGREYEVNARRSKMANVRISVRVSPPGLRASGDPERLHQVVMNLVENAARHSPDGGVVQLIGRGEGGRVRLEVIDEGPGIPEQERARVFERFYRTDAARSAKEGGTGLGLAIARWIVDLHDGDIRAEAREPHGCRMVVLIPAEAR